MIVHLVLFNPKPTVSPARRQEFTAALERTWKQIDSLKRVIVGRKTEIDPGYARSFGDKTYEFMACLEFEDEAGLVQYLRHELHQELGRLFWEVCDSTIVMECRAGDALAGGMAEISG